MADYGGDHRSRQMTLSFNPLIFGSYPARMRMEQERWRNDDREREDHQHIDDHSLPRPVSTAERAVIDTDGRVQSSFSLTERLRSSSG